MRLDEVLAGSAPSANPLAGPQVVAASPARSGLAPVSSTPEHIGLAPHTLQQPVGVLNHPLAGGRYQTPLRYPGAKSGLAELIARLVDSAKSSTQVGKVELLVEPFAGGASTSLRLVGAGTVDRILLADADPLVAAFWQVAASQTDALIDRMTDEHARYIARSSTAALERWDHWRRWTPSPALSPRTARFETAVKCLILNRTTFSGILHGRAGPIGGRRQVSPYDIGCRFNVAALTERLQYVGYLYQTRRLVDVWCKDWKRTLRDVPEWYVHLIPDHVLGYIDPPYLEKSRKLYQRSFDSYQGNTPGLVSDLTWSNMMEHYRLSEYLRRCMRFRWILSYDSHPSLLNDEALYAAGKMTPSKTDKRLLGVKEWHITKRIVSLRYTASARNGRGPAEELLLTTLPPSTVPADDFFRVIKTPSRQ